MSETVCRFCGAPLRDVFAELGVGTVAPKSREEKPAPVE